MSAPLPPCQKSLSYGNGFHFKNCGRPATRGKFCALHDPDRPDKVKRREEAKERFERSCVAPPLAPEIVAVLEAAEAFDKAYYGEAEPEIVFTEAVGRWIAANRPGLPPEKE